MSKHIIILNKIVQEMSKTTSLYCVSPNCFIRDRKLPFQTTIKFIIGMQGNSLKKEIYDYFHSKSEMMTPSAFVQRRDKINASAFEHIFREFNKQSNDNLTINGYRLYAFDGTDLDYPDKDYTYAHMAHTEIGYEMFHINGMYDIANNAFPDIEIQYKSKTNEPAAAIQMLERYTFPNNSIILADRGYASLNLFEHINRKENVEFLIRCKNDYISEIKRLPMEELDKDISFELRTTQTNEDKIAYKARKAKYISGKSKFGKNKKSQTWDFESPFYMTIRVVRFQLSTGEYETIVTSLDRFRFPIEKIRELYHLRWGIETSFRTLKYAVGMINLHSIKENSILQEIWSSFIMYNLSSRIAAVIIVEQKPTKYTYKVNMTLMIHICYDHFRSSDESPPHLKKFILSNLTPIRPGRKDERKLTPKGVVCFNYRVS